jgi:nicotinate-nucleotide pyrophosphorylase
MPKYLIEVSHAEEVLACAHVVERFLNFGSHFVANADWGCMDVVHKAWITIETDTKEDARNILPPAYRANASIIQLNKFSMEEIEAILKHHGKK